MEKNKYKLLSYPITMGLAVTGKCNLKCIYCRTAETHDIPDSEELSENEIFKLLDEFAEKKVFQVVLYGGEPFVRKDMRKIIEHALQYKYQLSIATNGTLFSDEMISLLKANRRRFVLQLSLDSDRAESNDELRGKGTFAQVIRNLNRLKERGVFYDALAAVVTKVNWRDLSGLPRLAQEYNIPKVNLNSLMPIGRCKENASFLAIDDEENVEAALHIYEMVTRHSNLHFDGNMLNRALNILLYSKIITVNNYIRRISIHNCAVGRGRLMIRPDGYVVPCGAFWDYRNDNVREKGIGNIWKGSPLIQLIREIVGRENEYCTNCEMKVLCRGECMATLYRRRGKLFLANKVCKLLERMANEYPKAQNT